MFNNVDHLLNRFVSFSMDNFILNFKNYMQKSTYNESYKKLIYKLDEESIYAIDSFLNTMKKLPLPSKNYLVKMSYVLDDIHIQNIHREEKYLKDNAHKIKKKYNLTLEKITVNIFKYHCGLKQLPKEILQKISESNIIDAGAFWGDSLIILGKYNPKKIICFEPNSYNFSLLQKLVKNNNFNFSIKLNNLGVGHNNIKKNLYYVSNKQNHGASFISNSNIKNVKKEEKKIISIDEYYENVNEKLGLIKLDVEGMGLETLRGSINTIKKHKPVISCGVYHNYKELFLIKPFLESLNIGYKFKFLILNHKDTLKELTLLAF